MQIIENINIICLLLQYNTLNNNVKNYLSCKYKD